ncbi:MAG: zinc-dependent metalloprotease, partial [Bacteroidota bacterium]
WDTDRYLNIWIANTGDFITGYGTFPNQGTTAEQGIVVHPQYIGLNDSNNHPLGRVLVHEMGHFLGLYHTWNNDIECHIDDEVADTPFQEKAYFACPDFPQKSCGSSDMFMNFMDYVDDECMQLFTQGQMDRMKNTIRYFRPGLLHQQSNCFIEEQITEPSPFSIYPNPSRGSIYIRFEKNPPSILQLALYDLTGRLIVQREGLYQESIPIHLPPLSAGIYWLRINDKSQKLFIN